MSGVCIAPGPKSLQALAWLARVGASPVEPVRLVSGWSERLARDHVRRLVDAGLLRRVAMTRGQGSLLVITSAGAAMAALPARRVPRSVAPTTWAHTCACAWVAAWLQLRRQTRWAADEQMQWWSEREIAADAFWRHEVRYQDRRGHTTVGHRPDLAVLIAGRPVAVEVELQRKERARHTANLAMYAAHRCGEQPTFGGVVYVTGSDDVARAVRAAAADAGLSEPRLSIRSLDAVVEQTLEAAAVLAYARAQPAGAS
jgi:hypothetical protein